MIDNNDKIEIVETRAKLPRLGMRCTICDEKMKQRQHSITTVSVNGRAPSRHGDDHGYIHSTCLEKRAAKITSELSAAVVQKNLDDGPKRIAVGWGTVQVGDTVGGRIVRGLGTSWILRDANGYTSWSDLHNSYIQTLPELEGEYVQYAYFTAKS